MKVLPESIMNLLNNYDFDFKSKGAPMGMKLELSERFFIEELLRDSLDSKGIACEGLQSIDRLTGDASTRRYYRIICKQKTFVVCLDSPQADGKQHDFMLKQKFIFDNGIRVPELYDYRPEKGYFLQEDLGDKTFLQYVGGLAGPELEREAYIKVIDELIKFQNIDHGKVVESNLFTLSFDYKKYTEEIDFTILYFLEKFLGFNDKKIISELKDEFSKVSQRLASEKMILTHRDFHSRNIMVKDNDFVMIDFQDARMGIAQYDLVSLIEDCYYELHPDNKKFLKDYYFEQMGEEIIGQAKATFNQRYNDMLIQRIFKAIGSFSYIFDQRNDHRHLKYIGHSMEKLRVTMLGDHRYARLNKILMELYYAS